MMWETSRIERCTGSARVRTYSQMPNAAPTAHTNRPKNKIAWLVTAPWKKFTCSSCGNWMSASPAKALAPPNSAARKIPARKAVLFFVIRKKRD